MRNQEKRIGISYCGVACPTGQSFFYPALPDEHPVVTVPVVRRRGTTGT